MLDARSWTPVMYADFDGRKVSLLLYVSAAFFCIRVACVHDRKDWVSEPCAGIHWKIPTPCQKYHEFRETVVEVFLVTVYM